MLREDFIISSAVFARQAIFSALYIGKSSGKQDHCDLRQNHRCKERSNNNFKNVKNVKRDKNRKRL